MMTVSPLVVLEHSVRPQETWADIAACYGITVEQLYTINNLSPSAIAQPKQQLLIPVMLAYFQPQIILQGGAAKLYNIPNIDDDHKTLPLGTTLTIQAQTVDSRWFWVAGSAEKGWLETAVARSLSTGELIL